MPVLRRPVETAHELAVRVPERAGELWRLIDAVEPRNCSPLQTYVVDRLERVPGPAWLDGQTVEQAMRATEMLGVILAFGPKPNLQKFTPDDWDRAGRAGFAFTSRGEAGIRRALAGIQRNFEVARGVSGPQQHFGRLYQWLEFARLTKTRAPSRASCASTSSRPTRSQPARPSSVRSFTIAAGTVWPRCHASPACTTRRCGTPWPRAAWCRLGTSGPACPRRSMPRRASGWRPRSAGRCRCSTCPRPSTPREPRPSSWSTPAILVPLDRAAAGSRMRVGCAVDQADINAFLSALRCQASRQTGPEAT